MDRLLGKEQKLRGTKQTQNSSRASRHFIGSCYKRRATKGFLRYDVEARRPMELTAALPPGLSDSLPAHPFPLPGQTPAGESDVWPVTWQ